MNRSVDRRQFATSGVTPREMVVVTWFEHPERGPVRCSAAPLVAASLRRRGLSVRTTHLSPHPAPGPEDAVMFTVSYLDPTGNAVGFGVAAHVADHVALSVAHDSVEAWATALRTRRVLVAETSPMCGGARRARQMVEHVLDRTDRRVYLLGNPGAGTREPAELEHRGVVSADSLDQVPDDATLVIPAHGATLAVRAEAGARGIEVVDATCPLVATAHANVRRFADDGDRVVLVGKAGHAATPAFVGQAPDAAVLVESVDDVAGLQTEQEPMSYVVEGGLVIEDAARVVAALRSRHPRIRGAHPDGLCYAASDHAETVRTVASACDVMFVLHAEGSTDCQELIDSTTSCGAEVHAVANLGEIRFDWLVGAGTVGLASTVSAHPHLREQVITALSGLGPLSTVHRTVQTKTVDGQYPIGTARPFTDHSLDADPDDCDAHGSLRCG